MTSLPDPVIRPALGPGLGYVDPVLQEAEVRIKEFMTWQADDVVPVDDDVRARALEILAGLVDGESMPSPAIVPGFDGSIQLEWHGEGRQFDVLVGPSQVSVYFCDETSGHEWERPFDDVADDAVKIVASFADIA